MIYEFQCQSCGALSDRQVRVAQRHDPQECGEGGCEGVAIYRFNPEAVSFVLKGYGWPTHDARASKSMKEKQRKSRATAREHTHRPELQPNFGGKPTETWADAKDAAFQSNAKGDTERGYDLSSYDKFVGAEKKIIKGTRVSSTGATS